MTNSEVLNPGQSIRPKISPQEAKELVKKLYDLECESVCELDGYDDRNFKVTIETGDHQVKEYVLKILNSLDSKKVDFIEAQNELLIFLCNNNISCPNPVRTTRGTYYTLEKLDSGVHIVRLMKFIPGVLLHKVPELTENLFGQIGAFVATLDKALENFHHIAYTTHKTLWMLESVPHLRKFVFAIEDQERRKMIEDIIDEFEDQVLTKENILEKGMIHGDLNEQNILVDNVDGEWKIKSVLDFGDSQYSCYLYELAITMTYAMILGKNMKVGGYVAKEYNKIRQITDEEWNLLKICIEARLCQSLVMGAYSSMQDPGNAYILTTAKPGWILLSNLRETTKDDLLNIWQSILSQL